MSGSFGRGIGSVNSTRDFALLRSPVHSVDARSKWVVTLAFAVTVTSFGKYDISRVMPLFLYPFVITALSGLPVPAVAKRAAAALPFISASCGFAVLGIMRSLFILCGRLRCGSLPFFILLLLSKTNDI